MKLSIQPNDFISINFIPKKLITLFMYHTFSTSDLSDKRFSPILFHEKNK